MNKKIEDESRAQIALFLPDAIARALTSYHRFAEQSVPDGVKEFSAHHSACKVAIAHVELLLKLARWADLPDAQADDHNGRMIMTALLQEAEAEVLAYNEREGVVDIT